MDSRRPRLHQLRFPEEEEEELFLPDGWPRHQSLEGDREPFGYIREQEPPESEHGSPPSFRPSGGSSHPHPTPRAFSAGRGSLQQIGGAARPVRLRPDSPRTSSRS
jgi:hypothetical protein